MQGGSKYVKAVFQMRLIILAHCREDASKQGSAFFLCNDVGQTQLDASKYARNAPPSIVNLGQPLCGVSLLDRVNST